MDADSRRFLFKVVTDIVCLLLVGFPILIFYLAGTPYQRGFFCDDDSLRHPFHESTVTNVMLYIFGLGLPILTMLATEFLIFRFSRNEDEGNGKERTVLSRPVPGWLWQSYCHIGVFGFGAACSQLTTDIAKYTIGRLRPHFFAVCQPEIDCRDPVWHNVYIENFRCRGFNQKLLKDVRLSFPSGHASFSAYCMIYLAMYVHARMSWRGSKLLKHLIQYLAIVLALYTSLSRISDYKHHWSDVLVGAIQGAIVAILIVVYVSDLFPKRHPMEQYEAPVDHDVYQESIPETVTTQAVSKTTLDTAIH